MTVRSFLAAATLVVVAAGSSAHIVYGRPSLHLLVVEADVVARARVDGVSASPDVGLEGERRPLVVAELLEVLKGDVRPGPVRFAQHGHGVARFAAGQEVLVFLRRAARVRELGALEQAGAVEFVSVQEHDAEFPLEGPSRGALLEAVRTYVRVETLPDAEARGLALRQATVDLLRSGDAELAGSALSDLVLAAGVPLLTAEDLPAVEPLLSDATLAAGVRTGLLAELSRRGLIDGPPAWVRLLETVPAADLPAVARAAGAHPSPPVTARLVVLLGAADDAVAEAAAIGLGHPLHAVAAARLARCLEQDRPRLRNAAVRGLLRIGSPEAQLALELAAATHPDPGLRRRAGAALQQLTNPG